MADLGQLERALVNADAAGDTEAATALAAELKKARAAPAPKQEPNKAAAEFRRFLPPLIGGPLAPDILMGARQVWDAAAQLAARGAEGAANLVGGSKTLTGMRQDTEAVNKAALADYQSKFDPENTPGASFGRGVGQALATAPITPAIRAGGALKSAAAGAGVGAGAGALTPVYDGDFAAEKGKQVGTGAAFGGALGAAAGALGKAAPTQEARALQDAGVRVPVGRAAGGAASRLEEGAESVPIVGDMIRGSHRQAVEDFNRATFNKVLEPIGQTLSPKTIGREAVKETRQKIGAVYENVLDQIKRVDLDQQFAQEGAKISAMTSELGESAQRQFLNILRNRVQARITTAGTMSAQTMKAVDSDLGRLAAGFRKSQDPNMQGLGSAIQEVQRSLRANVERVAERMGQPELAKQLQAANSAWSQWVRVADASSRAGSKEGIFSPAALRAAVAKADKRGFREGDAVLQDWAQQAEAVLGPKVPDSGTPFRLLGTAGLGGMFVDPTIAATGAAMAIPYTGIGQKAATALARKVDKAGAIAPYLGLLAPSLLANQ